MSDPGIGRLILLNGRRARTVTRNDLDDGDQSYGTEAHGTESPAARLRSLLGGALPFSRLTDVLRGRALHRRLRHAGIGDVAKVLYHEPNFIPRPFGGPCTVTVHDLFWRERPDIQPPGRARWIRRNLPRLMRQASGFAFVSSFTASEFARHFDLAGRPTAITPNAPGRAFLPIDPQAAAPVLSRHGLADRRFVLAVGTLEPRKNFERLVDAHCALPLRLRSRHPLVIAGGGGWGGVADRLGDRRNAGEVRLLGHVPEIDLPALFARASIVAHVSLHEGFGLPIVEAMAAGTPVLTGSGSAMEETAGGAALVVDPLETDAIRDGMRRLLEDDECWRRCRSDGLSHAATFRWEKTVEELVSLWRRCLAL